VEIKNTTPEKFSFTDTLLISAGVIVFLDFAIANIYMRQHGVNLNTAILTLSNLWMLVLNILVVAGIFLWLLRTAVLVRVKSLAEKDSLMAMVLGALGTAKPKTEMIVNKKGVTWTKLELGKTEIFANANEVLVAGHWLTMRRIKQLLKSRAE
jgi:hypothetical protein